MSENTKSQHRGMVVQAIILIISGIFMILFAAISPFFLVSHEALLTSFVILGSALIVAGCFLPRMGGDFEIGPKGIKGKLGELDDNVSIAENQIPAPAVTSERQKKTTTANKGPAEEVISLALTSPTAALLMLSSHIEHETKRLLSSAGWLPESGALTFTAMLRELELRKLLPVSLLSSVANFREIRNSVTHASRSISENEVLAAIEGGISILRMIQAIPRENHYVHKAGVTLYSDPTATHTFSEATGVILENKSPSSLGARKSIFPTTRKDYKVGQQLGWQWNMNKIYPRVWYKDPDDNKIKEAWVSSAEFNGEIIPAILN